MLGKLTRVTSGAMLLAALLGGATAGAELKVGDQAPDFELTGSDGKIYKLSDYRGEQPVVVAWFPKAFTGGWTRECNALRASALDKPLTVTLLNGAKVELAPSEGSGLDKFEVVYFTATCDTPETVKKYAEALKLDYPILSDPSKEVAAEYGVVHEGRSVPERWTFYIGKDGKILHIDKKVNAANHGQQIAEKLKDLGISKEE